MSGRQEKPGTVIDRRKSVIIHVHSVSKKMARSASRVYLSKFGVGLTEWRIVSVLAELKGATATALCEYIDLDKAAASRSIKVLKEQGYVKSRSRNDGTRSTVIELSASGWVMHDRLLQLSMAREARLLQGLSDREVRSLLRMLKHLEANATAMDDLESGE